MILSRCKWRHLFQQVGLAVNADADQARLFGSTRALRDAHPRRPRTIGAISTNLVDCGQGKQRITNRVGRLLCDRRTAFAAVRRADASVQQSQVVVDLRDRRHGAADAGRTRFLVDRQRRCKPVDRIDIGTGNLIEELPRVRRETVDVLPLAFGVQRVEGKRTLAAARDAGDHGHRIAGDIEVDILQIVNRAPADLDRGVWTSDRRGCCAERRCRGDFAVGKRQIRSTGYERSGERLERRLFSAIVPPGRAKLIDNTLKP